MCIRDSTFSDLSPATVALDLILDDVQVQEIQFHTLTVSTSPDLGATVSVSPSDLNGDGAGSSAFTRAYLDGTVVDVAVPFSHSGKFFQKWQLGGVDYGTGLVATVTMDADLSLVAVYVDGGPGGQPFSNGGFESGYSGWTATGNQNVASSAPYAPSEGTNLVAFNGGNSAPNAALSQTFATTPGQSYSCLLYTSDAADE